MVDCLDGLRHHCVIGCDNDDGQVGELGTSCTHRREGLVSRGVEEGDLPAVGENHVVCSDVLCDSSGLSRDHIGLADIVQQGSLAVVDVAHHCDDRRPGLEVLLPVRLAVLIDFIGKLGGHELHLVSELLGDENEGLRIEPLVDGYHQSEVEAGSDNLVHRSVVHKGSEVIDGHELGDFQYFPLCSLLSHLLLCLQ